MDVIINKLNKNGYYILNEYFTNDDIDQLLNNFKNIIDQYNKKCQHQNKEQLNMDYRLFGIENCSPLVHKLITNNSFFNQICNLYMNPVKQYIQGTLLTFLKPIDGIQANSGGTWHRDTHNKIFKILIYLNDVNEENGCFQFITHSNKKYIGLPKTNSGTTTRYSNKIIDNLIKNNNCKKISVCGKAGTVILVDTSYIHRGKPIENGERYVYTNYYKNYPQSQSKNIQIWKNAYIEKTI